MASRKRQPEGIALLSMYNDEEEEEEDEEMEDAVEEREDELLRSGSDDDRRASRSNEDSAMADSDRGFGGDSGEEENITRDVLGFEGNNSAPIPGKAQLRPPTPATSQTVNLNSERNRRGKLTIVDYGHDEVTMSPELEEGLLGRSGRVTFSTDRQSENGDFRDATPSGTVQVLSPGNQSTPQISDPLQSDRVNYGVSDSEPGDASVSITEQEKNVDPLDKFLPPPPKDKCSEELQRKINKFLDYKKAGRSFNAEVRNRKDYRNPDFLLHAVSYQGIDQIGSCFDKDVFDPHGYDKSDFYDEIEADMRRDMDRKEQERKKSQKVDFLSAGTQLGATKINLPVPGVPTPVIAGLTSALASAGDGRQNKKSKWDKVDNNEQKIPLPSGAQDPSLTVGANASGGYMAFAQQRRREAEEKRSSERKLERRT